MVSLDGNQTKIQNLSGFGSLFSNYVFILGLQY